jgi:hypothetical protein
MMTRITTAVGAAEPKMIAPLKNFAAPSPTATALAIPVTTNPGPTSAPGKLNDPYGSTQYLRPSATTAAENPPHKMSRLFDEVMRAAEPTVKNELRKYESAPLLRAPP